MKIEGYRSYIGASIMIALGVLVVLGAAFRPGGGFESGQDSIVAVVGWFLILQGATIIFHRLATGRVEKKIDLLEQKIDQLLARGGDENAA